MTNYQPQEIEPKWLDRWDADSLYATPEASDKPKYYVLEMFPYPSGHLHMGHVRNYSIGDCFARFKRMNGYNVLHPFGYDSFGLPAENAAIKNKLDPEKWTLDNIEFMTGQVRRLGLGYDWDRIVVTCKDDYYRWNQWLFIKMMEKGLVYRKKGWVNWDPVDQTVLANEQVIDGKGWRSGAVVEKREIEQWYIKITDYAEELLTGLDQLHGWPERVRTMQRNWIGRSEGAEIRFDIENSDESITVYTTRPDTLFGVTYVVLAPEHPLVYPLAGLGARERDVTAYVQGALRKSVAERGDAGAAKTGVWTGVNAVNPATGDLVPVFVSDYVLMEYGTGAVMAVPAHDERDFEFAKTMSLPVRVVISSDGQEVDSGTLTSAFTEPGILVGSGPFSGQASSKAKQGITAELSAKGKAKAVVKYRLRDWLISRQRYWGTPIPIMYDEAGNPIPVPEAELPVRLPKSVAFTGKGNPLEHADEFRNIQKDGKSYRRETDTMDTFFDSSWYFARYCDPKNTSLPFDSKLADYWLPVDQYIGGIEHAVLHLLYARFFTKVTRDLGLHHQDEPAANLLCQGMVLKDGSKMSKSVGNTVDPSQIISKYGADTTRLFILFGAPVERDLDWSDAGVEGAFRFLNRVYRLATELPAYPVKNDVELDRMVHKTIKAVTEDLGRFSFNTAISRLMELVNYMYANGCNQQSAEALVLMLAPFAPMMTEELWNQFGHHSSVHLSDWPKFDAAKTIDDVVTLVMQVNGKVRDKLEVKRGMSQSEAEILVTQSERIQKFLQGQTVVKVIYVQDKLLNIVARS